MAGSVPVAGAVVWVRRRHWLVTEVKPGEREADAAAVRLRCLDDDAAGEPLEVLWEAELGTRVFAEEELRLGSGLDDPRAFGCWLLALQWACVTATDRALFQAPFRAGIAIKPYQLEPLRKALALPRVNLFIADDVGLGKTIEAGLVLQEMLLRQRVERVLVVCPPAITLQWKEELAQRFGLSFAIYDREWISARRRERGWGVNPWATHTRFIVPYTMLRGGAGQGQHLELLIQSLGDRAGRSLLILDEVHQAAPASGSVYAVDSRTTHAIRQIVHRFEHRLFLSATPHNGHSNSFSTLLSMLDPQRFTRGVAVSGVAELEPVMVRRLKRDLREEVGGLPARRLVDHVLRLPSDAPEIRLGRMLAAYEEAYRASLRGAGVRDVDARALVCVSLHKRLLSSIVAFSRTLEVHARGVGKAGKGAAPGGGQAGTQAALFGGGGGAGGAGSIGAAGLAWREPEEDLSGEERAKLEEEWVEVVSADPGGAARALLEEMRRVAAAAREVPDVRLRELARWIRENCMEPGGAGGAGGRWGRRRVVVFTEYDDTLQWIARHLPGLIGATGDGSGGDRSGGDGGDGRIGRYTGGMSEESRERLKEAFNSDPARSPLRVLLCTDAAREGINLQAQCADLFHFDLPWNPGRVEQRNGRIDRTLQPEPEVRCHYFDLPDRPEDRVLTYMVRKIARIQEELGSLSDVLSERLAARMEAGAGLRGLDEAEIDRLTAPDQAALEAVAVLEGRGSGAGLRGDLRALARIYEGSRRQMGWREDHLMRVVDTALRMVSEDGGGLVAVPGSRPQAYRLPQLDASWDHLLDAMREPLSGARALEGRAGVRERRRQPLRPITFEANDRMDAPAVQLHLAHPLVRRLLQRFVAPGWSGHDLNRVTVLAGADRVRRVIAFARLVLFGPGASRLHEEVIYAAGQVGADGSLRAFAEAGTERSYQSLAERLAEGAGLHPSVSAREGCATRAAGDFRGLRGELDRLRVAAEGAARAALRARAEEEATAMLEILDRQEAGIRRALTEARQLQIQFTRAAREEREQFERDQRFLELRVQTIAEERKTEPTQIREGYQVELVRFEPMGILYLWPVEQG